MLPYNLLNHMGFSGITKLYLYNTQGPNSTPGIINTYCCNGWVLVKLIHHLYRTFVGFSHFDKDTYNFPNKANESLTYTYTMIDYKQGKVYLLNHTSGKLYVACTTLSVRLGQHWSAAQHYRKKKTPTRQLYLFMQQTERNEWTIELSWDFPCETARELTLQEFKAMEAYDPKDLLNMITGNKYDINVIEDMVDEKAEQTMQINKETQQNLIALGQQQQQNGGAIINTDLTAEQVERVAHYADVALSLNSKKAYVNVFTVFEKYSNHTFQP